MDRFGEQTGRVIFFVTAAGLVGLVLVDMICATCGMTLELHGGQFSACTAMMVAGLGLTHLCKKDTTHAEETSRNAQGAKAWADGYEQGRAEAGS